MWNNFRYDYFTYRAADAAIRVIQPRVLFVNFGETDEWGMVVAMTCTHDAARRNDLYIRQIWETLQSIEQYHDKTTLIGTTITDEAKPIGDHTAIHCLAATAFGLRRWALQSLTMSHCNESFTQSQFAATVAAALGHDFCQTAIRWHQRYRSSSAIRQQKTNKTIRLSEPEALTDFL